MHIAVKHFTKLFIILCLEGLSLKVAVFTPEICHGEQCGCHFLRGTDIQAVESVTKRLKVTTLYLL